jgi:hypothetical protein
LGNAGCVWSGSNRTSWEKDGAEIVAARADTPFESVDDLWRRADVPVASLVQVGGSGRDE